MAGILRTATTEREQAIRSIVVPTATTKRGPKAVRAFFEWVTAAGDMEYKDAAATVGLTKGTIQRYSQEDGWHQERDRYVEAVKRAERVDLERVEAGQALSVARLPDLMDMDLIAREVEARREDAKLLSVTITEMAVQIAETPQCHRDGEHFGRLCLTYKRLSAAVEGILGLDKLMDVGSAVLKASVLGNGDDRRPERQALPKMSG